MSDIILLIWLVQVVFKIFTFLYVRFTFTPFPSSILLLSLIVRSVMYVQLLWWTEIVFARSRSFSLLNCELNGRSFRSVRHLCFFCTSVVHVHSPDFSVIVSLVLSVFIYFCIFTSWCACVFFFRTSLSYSPFCIRRSLTNSGLKNFSKKKKKRYLIQFFQFSIFFFFTVVIVDDVFHL